MNIPQNVSAMDKRERGRLDRIRGHLAPQNVSSAALRGGLPNHQPQKKKRAKPDPRKEILKQTLLESSNHFLKGNSAPVEDEAYFEEVLGELGSDSK